MTILSLTMVDGFPRTMGGGPRKARAMAAVLLVGLVLAAARPATSQGYETEINMKLNTSTPAPIDAHRPENLSQAVFGKG
jgi:hypothetical protein